MPPQTAAVLFEEGSAQSEDLGQQDGVRVHERAETPKHFEHVGREILELVALGGELEGVGGTGGFGCFWSIAGKGGKEGGKEGGGRGRREG